MIHLWQSQSAGSVQVSTEGRIHPPDFEVLDLNVQTSLSEWIGFLLVVLPWSVETGWPGSEDRMGQR